MPNRPASQIEMHDVFGCAGKDSSRMHRKRDFLAVDPECDPPNSDSSAGLPGLVSMPPDWIVMIGEATS
jgi:hypothetical protein